MGWGQTLLHASHGERSETVGPISPAHPHDKAPSLAMGPTVKPWGASEKEIGIDERVAWTEPHSGTGKAPLARYDFIAAYIMANRRNGAIYVGSAADLPTRIGQHKAGVGARFTAKHQCFTLVWFERIESMSAAAQMERRLKRWKRDWKIDLIERTNKHWLDLSSELL